MMNAKSLVASLFGILLILVLLLTSVDVFSFDRSYFASQSKSLDVAEKIGVSDADLALSTDVLLDYLRDKRDDLDVMVTISGQRQPMYNQREIDHMVDVKVLYLNAMLFRNIAMILCGVIAAILFAIYQKKAFRYLARGIQNASTIFAVILVFLIGYALVDFNAFWTQFHHIFFRNDLWLLDPNTDNLILMVPLPFFFGLVIRIVLGFIASFGLINLAAWFVQRSPQKS